MVIRAFEPAPIRQRLRLPVAPEHAFAAFTNAMTRWWLASRSIGKSRLAEVVIEPKAGGRWYERGDDGAETDWGRALAWEPPNKLLLVWQVDYQKRFDPALTTEVEVSFRADGRGGSWVELEHRHLERYGDRSLPMRALLDGPTGWPVLLQRYSQVATARY